MARLPVPGQDAGDWGNLLNEYLEVTHDTGGALKSNVVADAQVSASAAISADKLADGTTNKLMTAAERTKLTGIATGATANDTNANLRDRSTHTGTQSADTLTDGTTNRLYSSTEKTKLAGIASNADITSLTTVGTAVSGATAKTTPIDADTIPLTDSAASSVLKKVTWANVKATLKTYYDTLYATATHTHVATTDLTATGTKDSTTYLRGDNTWATPATGAPTASPTFTGTATFSGRSIVTPDTVTYAATTTIDASTGNHFRITLTGNLTLAAPSNPTDGQRILIELIQNGTGGYTLTLDSAFNVTTSITGAITLVTTANTRTYIGAVYRSAGTKWDILAFGTGVAA